MRYFWLPLLALWVATAAQAAVDVSPIDIRPQPGQDYQDYVDFDGNRLDYDSASDTFVISGDARLLLGKRELSIQADRIEYSPGRGKLLALGSVMIEGTDQVTFSKRLEMDLETSRATLQGVNSQSGNVRAEYETSDLRTVGEGEWQQVTYLHGTSVADIQAKKADISVTKEWQTLNYYDGTALLNQPVRLAQSQGNGESRSLRLESNLERDPGDIIASGTHFQLEMGKATYYPDRIQNNLYTSGGKLKIGESGLFLPLPPGIFTVGDSTQQMFGVTLGNEPRTGADDFNVGPKLSFVLGDPEDKRAISVSPFGQFISGLGVGGFAQYTDPRTDALIGYGSVKDRGLAEVSYRLSQYNDLEYGWNSYMAGGITRQFARLNDRRSFEVPILGRFLENESVNLNGDISFAVDSDELRREEDNQLSDLQEEVLGDDVEEQVEGFRFQESLTITTKPLVKFGTSDYNVGLRLTSQTNLRAYTTGDLQVFTSIRPRLEMNAGRWGALEAGYDQRFIEGDSPFGFDQVIEGSQSVFYNGDLNLTRWLSLGSYGVFSFDREEFTAFIGRIVVGPEDFKVSIGFDPVRGAFTFGFNLLFDGTVDFERFRYRKNRSGETRRF